MTEVAVSSACAGISTMAEVWKVKEPFYDELDQPGAWNQEPRFPLSTEIQAFVIGDRAGIHDVR